MREDERCSVSVCFRQYHPCRYGLVVLKLLNLHPCLSANDAFRSIMCDLAPVSNCRVFCTCLLVWTKEQAVGDVFLVSWECLPGHSETRQLAVRAGPPSVKLEHLTVTTSPPIDRHTYNTCIHVYNIQEGMLPILASKRAVLFLCVCVSPSCIYNIMCSTGQWIVLHILHSRD
jgi:hypothetical protein